VAKLEINFDSADAPTIRKFWECEDFVRVIIGPFGSGKSSGCTMEIIRRAMAQQPSADGIRRTRWAVIRNTYGELRDTTIKTVHDWLPPEHFGTHKWADFEYTIDKIPGARIELMFRALDRPEHVRKLLSAEYTGAWVNEIREVPWGVIEMLQGRVGRYPSKRDGGPTWQGVIGDTNPPDTDSRMYQVLEEEHPEGHKLFRQPSGRGPNAENLKNLPDGYYKRLATGKSDDFVRVYVDGDYGYVQDGKPVYPDYVDTVHCLPGAEPMAGRPIRRAWDFGLTPACVMTQLHPSGRWIIFDEVTTERSGFDRFSDDVLEYMGRQWRGFEVEADTGDPAGEQGAQTDERTCFAIARGKGINMQPGDQSLEIRTESVASRLRKMIDGRPAMALNPRCKSLRKGFQGRYAYRRVQVGGSEAKYTDKPDKNRYSHPHDALQYDATALFGGLLKGQQNVNKMPKIKYPKIGIV
jgi:hypothetical protein